MKREFKGGELVSKVLSISAEFSFTEITHMMIFLNFENLRFARLFKKTSSCIYIYIYIFSVEMNITH